MTLNKLQLILYISPGSVHSCHNQLVTGEKLFSSNSAELLMCSFDGGEPETCSFPLEVDTLTFGVVPQSTEVTVYDEQGLNLTFSFNFDFADGMFP